MSLTHFRPVGLCNMIYNIVAKCLTYRLKGIVMGMMISGNQSAFVPYRLITIDILIVHELLYIIRLKT